jgi:cytochrome o ubiquinol oxidase subunit IV
MSHSHLTESDYGTGKKTLSVYVIGVALCIILTLIPFGVVMRDVMSHSHMLWTLIGCALLQLIVQVVCFLRLTTETEQGKSNVMCFLFTIVVAFVVVGGSMWIMFHLNYNMMH